MKRITFAKLLATMLVATSVITVVFWDHISEAFGPMKQQGSQCLICHRKRVVKWVCGSKVNDAIITNEYSDWIDTFTPVDHEHVWLGHTGYHRTRWFGSTIIACGGVATIPRIFEQRSRLGEPKSQQLAARFHEVVENQSPQFNWNELNSFTQSVVDDPESLLQANSPE
ncbi:MAG: hypothetical protein KDB05_27780 [Planctomycetales bacterium]|nr:hypothetical protein [Planctomycetales bacterium]